MKEKSHQSTADRRSFLKLAGVGAVAGGAALVSGRHSAEAADAPSSDGQSYKETEHVKTYYDLARF